MIHSFFARPFPVDYYEFPNDISFYSHMFKVQILSTQTNLISRWFVRHFSPCSPYLSKLEWLHAWTMKCQPVWIFSRFQVCQGQLSPNSCPQPMLHVWQALYWKEDTPEDTLELSLDDILCELHIREQEEGEYDPKCESH